MQHLCYLHWDEFEEITACKGYIPKSDYTRVLGVVRTIDNSPAVPIHLKSLNDMENQ